MLTFRQLVERSLDCRPGIRPPGEAASQSDILDDELCLLSGQKGLVLSDLARAERLVVTHPDEDEFAAYYQHKSATVSSVRKQLDQAIRDNYIIHTAIRADENGPLRLYTDVYSIPSRVPRAIAIRTLFSDYNTPFLRELRTLPDALGDAVYDDVLGYLLEYEERYRTAFFLRNRKSAGLTWTNVARTTHQLIAKFAGGI